MKGKVQHKWLYQIIEMLSFKIKKGVVMTNSNKLPPATFCKRIKINMKKSLLQFIVI